MIISLEEAKEINNSIKESDILALEQAIIGYTNNNFRSNIHDEIKEINSQGLKVDNPNQFLVGDTIEIIGTTYEDGLAIVTEVTEDYVTINLSNRGKYPQDVNEGAMVYLIEFPPDIKTGAIDVLSSKTKSMQKTGIKSESVGRMSITYANVTDSQNTIFGVDANYFSFLDPYRKFDWS